MVGATLAVALASPRVILSTANIALILAATPLQLLCQPPQTCVLRKTGAARCGATWGGSQHRLRECCAYRWSPSPGRKCAISSLRYAGSECVSAQSAPSLQARESRFRVQVAPGRPVLRRSEYQRPSCAAGEWVPGHAYPRP